MADKHVIFGAGPLGKWTARELVRQGQHVCLVNRSGKADRLPEGVEVIASDAYDRTRNMAVTEGAAVIYQCAQPHYYEWAEKFPALQAAILAAAEAHQTKFVVGDNLYMYGAPGGQPLREDSPLVPTSVKGRVRAAMAQAIMQAHEKGRVRVAIGRASDFFGPDDHALTGYAIQPALEGKPISLVGRPDQPHTFTYVPDFGRALATLGLHDEAFGQVWFAPSNPPVTQLEFARLIEKELGRPVKIRLGGALMLRLLGLFSREIGATVEMLYQWTAPFIVDTTKFQKTFAISPTPWDEAIRQTLAWCREA